ncbi:hypothetical protein NKG94_17655 [Micromonospora sp. M12]
MRLGDRAVGDLTGVVFRPSASAGSLRSAVRQPWLASSRAYGRVTLVSAYVLVFGTAPGMFATQ